MLHTVFHTCVGGISAVGFAVAARYSKTYGLIGVRVAIVGWLDQVYLLYVSQENVINIVCG